MKALSLWQPWASALFTPLKSDETRHWPIPTKLIGEPIAIHASLTDTRETRVAVEDFFMIEETQILAEFAKIGIRSYGHFPRGCIIGWCVFSAPLHTSGMTREQWLERSPLQQRFGDYSPKRFAWPKQRAELFDQPYPCTGRQGFFDWTRPEEP